MGKKTIVAAGSAVAVIAAVALTASPAMAWPGPGPQAFWVSTAATSAGADTSCQTAGYSTVQSAVTAAQTYDAQHPGAIPAVNICPGTYSEQLTITGSVSLTRAPVPAGLGPVTIQLPAAVGGNQSLGRSSTSCQAEDAAKGIQAPQSVIEVCGGVQVSVNDLTVAGNWPGSVCYDSLYGVLVGGGGSLSLTDSTVERIGAYPLNGCQGGVGVEVGLAPTGQVGHATMRGDTIETYQKNGITVDGPGSTADISDVTVTGAGATPAIAQNGIQVSFGATASVSRSTITGNNYTGSGNTEATGILVAGGGGSACGIGAGSPLVRNAIFTGNQLTGNDIGIAFSNTDPTCTKSPSTSTHDTACGNTIENDHGYPSADANVTGFSATVGYQAGISDTGNQDVICGNFISGAGYAPRDATSSLPNPAPPAFVRPIDIVSTPAIAPEVYGNFYDGRPYGG
jgi:hypothetical protein